MRLAAIVFCLGFARVAVGADALPDWSGWWGLGPAPQQQYAIKPAPLKAAKRAEMAEGKRANVAGRFCRPPEFVGINGNFVVNFEFLFTPGRVTITNENGLLRRIYTDGRPLPKNPLPSSSGTSVGHWEGQTLVVETTGIKPDAPLGPFGPIGRNVRITERIWLKEKDVLQFDLVTVAPDLFEAPDRRTYLLARVPGKREPIAIDFCVDNDRSYDSAAGQERLDMTPPPDLPPPPAN